MLTMSAQARVMFAVTWKMAGRRRRFTLRETQCDLSHVNLRYSCIVSR